MPGPFDLERFLNIRSASGAAFSPDGRAGWGGTDRLSGADRERQDRALAGAGAPAGVSREVDSLARSWAFWSFARRARHGRLGRDGRLRGLEVPEVEGVAAPDEQGPIVGGHVRVVGIGHVPALLIVVDRSDTLLGVAPPDLAADLPV